MIGQISEVVFSVPHEYLKMRYPAFKSVPARNIFAAGDHETQVRGPVLEDQGMKIIADYIEARRHSQTK